MAMYDLDSFAYDDIAEDWEEGEDGRKGGFAVDDEEGHVVDFETVGQVAHACSTRVRMCNDDDFVAAIDEFLKLVSIRTKGACKGWFTLDSWYI